MIVPCAAQDTDATVSIAIIYQNAIFALVRPVLLQEIWLGVQITKTISVITFKILFLAHTKKLYLEPIYI
jgi:hypothetical protein